MSEKYITLAEVRDLLTEEYEKREGEFNAVQKAAMSHSQTIAKITAEEAEALVEEVSQLEFVTDAIAYKIADLLPVYSEDVHAIFQKERGINLSPEDIDSIIDIVSKYL